MNWNIKEEMKLKLQPQVEKLARLDPEYVTHQLCRTLGMAKAWLPPMTKKQATLLANTFNGIGLPSADLVPTSYLPELIASHVYSEVLEQPGSEPFIRELEDATGDDDWQQKFGEMPLIKFVEELKAMDPLQANLLLVAIEYFWIWRKNMPLAEVRLEDFFNIQYRPRS